MKTALVTGCCGQAGSYLTEHLVGLGYSVVGVTRPSGERRLDNLTGVLDSEDRNRKLQFKLHYGDVTDPHLIVRLAQEEFDEAYLFAGQTQVYQSFMDPIHTLRTNAESPIAFFDAFKRYSPRTRIYFPSSSEMFGCIPVGTQAKEDHPFESHSPYAVAKTSAFLAARMYRQLGQFIVGGIAFNHESQRRGANFVTRKLGLGLRKFKRTGQPVRLGAGGMQRDWHHALDTVHGAWLSLQYHEPGEYIFASGVARTVYQFAMDLCAVLEIPNPKEAVIFGQDLEPRPWDINYLCGDPSKAENQLGWVREKSYEDLLLDVSAE